MNKPTNSPKQFASNISKTIVAVLVTSYLAITAATAQTEVKLNAPPKHCEDWPCKDGTAGCKEMRIKIKKLFEDLIDKAATDKKLRDQLLDPTDCHKAAWQIVHDQLKAINVDFGTEQFVAFYEPENEMGKSESAQNADYKSPYPNNHCYHIFYIPKGGSSAPKATFDENLRCCYQPWITK
jgi:hypothetical protein